MSKLTDDIVLSYLNDGYGYYDSRTKLKLNDDGELFYKGLHLGQFVTGASYYDEDCKQFLLLSTDILTTRDKNVLTLAKSLTNSANKNGLYVLFNNIDMYQLSDDVSINNPYELQLKDVTYLLIKAAKYMGIDKDKNVVCGITSDGNILITYNQEIYGDVIHCEDILCYGAETILEDTEDEIMSIFQLLEPCKNCLASYIVRFKVKLIQYGHLHESEWNTPEYIQLTNDIFTKRYSYPKKYEYCPNRLIDRFYNKHPNKLKEK